MNLPMLLSRAVVVILHFPFRSTTPSRNLGRSLMMICSVLVSIGAGLLSTFHANTGHAEWIGYQCLFGIGNGLGIGQIQALDHSLVELDAVYTFHMRSLWYSLTRTVLISIGQNVLINRLAQNLHKVLPDLDSRILLRVGAGEVIHAFSESSLGAISPTAIMSAFNLSITQTFYVIAAVGAISVISVAWVKFGSTPPQDIENVTRTTVAYEGRVREV